MRAASANSHPPNDSFGSYAVRRGADLAVALGYDAQPKLIGEDAGSAVI